MGRVGKRERGKRGNKLVYKRGVTCNVEKENDMLPKKRMKNGRENNEMCWKRRVKKTGKGKC